MYKFINGIKPNPIVESKDIIGSGNEFDSSVTSLLNNINTDYHRSFPSRENKDMLLSLVAGRKFVKVIHDNSVWGFVAKLNGSHKGLLMEAGDVFKPASWASAAKHTRGSIFDTNTDWFRWTGPNYL